MTNETNPSPPRLHEVEPTEVSGRDTIARYQAQFRAAAFACLKILTGSDINRVYCDFHDDFVCRRTVADKPIYHFYQVKTKGKRNHLWNKTEVFGLNKKRKATKEKIAGSFAGKLVFHTIRFGTSCGSVVFLTNVHLDNELEATAAALLAGDFSDGVLKVYVDRFNEAFIDGDSLDSHAIRDKIGRLKLEPGVAYLDPQDSTFEALARDAIFQYSEIDLAHFESREIIQNLVALVEKKSFRKLLAELGESDLDDIAGIGVADLLEILSISKGAYRELLAGGDPSAIRNASIIQRKLSQAGADEVVIEYCSKCKVQWDIWLRDRRHTVPEFDLNFLLERLNWIKTRWTRGDIKFAAIKGEIETLLGELSAKDFGSGLSTDLLLGGVFSALVRSEAQ
jgi:hypothetical protein